MRNHRLIQGFVFETLLTVVAVGCGSSASDGGGGVGGVTAASGGETATGTSGAGIGGNAPPAGGNGSVATTAPTPGGASTGGAATALGGNAGTGGSAPAAATGVLGQQCSLPGTLGCNGINQKLTLVCGGDGKWQVNQTCNSATQVCDPRPGSTQGTCQEQDAECAAHGASAPYCKNDSIWACDAWGMSASKQNDCQAGGTCANGACAYPDCSTYGPGVPFCRDNSVWVCDTAGGITKKSECPADGVCYQASCITTQECPALGSSISCTDDCAGNSSGGCSASSYDSTLVSFNAAGESLLYVAHLSYAGGSTDAEIAQDLGFSYSCTSHPARRAYRTYIPKPPSAIGGYYYYRVTVPRGWYVVDAARMGMSCDQTGTGNCAETQYGGASLLLIYSDEVNSADFNLFIEFTPYDARRPCP